MLLWPGPKVLAEEVPGGERGGGRARSSRCREAKSRLHLRGWGSRRASPPPPVASPLRAELALREPGLESLQPSPPRAPTPPRNTWHQLRGEWGWEAPGSSHPGRLRCPPASPPPCARFSPAYGAFLLLNLAPPPAMGELVRGVWVRRSKPPGLSGCPGEPGLQNPQIWRKSFLKKSECLCFVLVIFAVTRKIWKYNIYFRFFTVTSWEENTMFW